MKILFTAIPVHSHIAPMLPLVDSAVRAGHEVAFVTGAEGVPLVERAGVRTIELGHSWADSSLWYTALLGDTRPDLSNPDDALLHYIVNVFVRHLGHGMAPGLIPLVAEMSPHVVISDMSELAGRAAATLAGVPHIVHGFGPQQSGTIAAPVGDAIAEMQSAYGISEEVSRGWNEELYLDVWPAVVEDRSRKMFENVLPLLPAVVSPALAADEILHGMPFDRTVYVTLGTMFNTTASGAQALQKLISVFDDEQVNAIVTVGRDGDVARFDTGRENVRVRDFVPQNAVLPYVDAVLSHGGAGTALGALAHGIPQVMMPIATDQHRIAERIVDAGAGLVVSQDSSVEEIRSAVHAALSDRRFTEGAGAVAPLLGAIPDADALLRDLVLGLHYA